MQKQTYYHLKLWTYPPSPIWVKWALPFLGNNESMYFCIIIYVCEREGKRHTDKRARQGYMMEGEIKERKKERENRLRGKEKL